MTAHTSVAPRVALLLVGVVLLLTGAVTQATEGDVTLKGFVEVAEYDDDGNVISVSVYDSEFGSVLISPAGKGGELTRHVDAEVEMTGQIVEMDDESGYAYVITVASFKVAKPAEPDDDRDHDPDLER